MVEFVHLRSLVIHLADQPINRFIPDADGLVFYYNFVPIRAMDRDGTHAAGTLRAGTGRSRLFLESFF
jgi:hypothetical protein